MLGLPLMCDFLIVLRVALDELSHAIYAIVARLLYI